MFPTNSERLIGISDAFSAFVYGYQSSCPRAHYTPNESVTTLRYTRRHGPVYIQAMPVGTYRVQSPGFLKIVYSNELTLMLCLGHAHLYSEHFTECDFVNFMAEYQMGFTSKRNL